MKENANLYTETENHKCRDELMRKSKIIFKTKKYGDKSSSLNVSSGTQNKFLTYDHSFTRNYEVNATVLKKDDNLFIVTSAHHNVKKSIIDPISQFTYSNFEPLYDFDFGSTEMLLKYENKDLDFINNVYPHGVGRGSDIWGVVNKKIYRNELIHEYYALVTTEKGMIIYKMDHDERVDGGHHFCIPIQFISGNTENTWGDVKSYDVTTVTFNIKEVETVKHFKKGAYIKFNISKRKVGKKIVEMPNIIPVYGKILDIINEKKTMNEHTHTHTHTHMDGHTHDHTHNEEKTMNKHTYIDGNTRMKMNHTTNDDNSINITVRMKTDYYWNKDDHAHDIEIVTKDLLKDKDKPFSLPEKIMTHLTVVESNRNVSCYFTKEAAGRLLAIDLKPLILGNFAKVTYDYFNEEDKPFVIEEGGRINEEGYMQGSHDVYVNEEQGILYNLGIKVKLEDERIVKTAICFDLKENHLKPKPVSLILDFPFNYLHDFVVESYDRSEQYVLLGIPMEKTKSHMYIGIGSTGDDYAIYDVTDINNIYRISGLEIEGGGYYHQAWFTTDKKYIVISDEVQPDNVKYINRIPLLRMYYDIVNEKLQLYHVQDFQNPFTSKNHNQYVVSNIDMFNYNNNNFEDWVFGSNYSSGVQAQSLKYKDFNKNDFTDEFFYQTRKDPFTIKMEGFIDTEVGLSDFGFGGVWSVYPFWELEKTADEIKYLTSGDHQITYFQYKSGAFNKVETDLHNDGKVQKCHPSTSVLPRGIKFSEKYDETRQDKSSNRSSKIDGITEIVELYKKDGTSENVILTPVGYSDKLDVQIYYVAIKDSNINDFIYLECADDVINNENIFGLCGNHICEGKVIKDIATDHYRVDKGQALDPYNYAQYIGLVPNNVILYSSRLGEIITNLPARSGDSGNPVVNSKNEFLGFINSVDVTGGNSGVVNICKGIKNFLKPMDLPSIKTKYSGFTGVFNNREKGINIDDPTKMAVVAINPRNSKMYFYVSTSITQYFMMNLNYSGYQPDERGTYRKVTDKSYASSIFSMNSKYYFSRSFRGSSFLQSAITIKIESKKECKFLFAEELKGKYKNKGPTVVFLGYDDGKLYDTNYKEYDEEKEKYYYYIKTYLVGRSSKNIDELYSDNLSINPNGILTGHPPKNDDVMKGDESKCSFTVIDEKVTKIDSKPSWSYEQSFRATASVYPFSENVPVLFPYYARGSNTLTNINDYDVTLKENDYVFNNDVSLTGFGETSIDQLKTSGLGCQIYQTNTINGESRITFSEGWNSVDNGLYLPFEENISVLKVNGENANNDNFEYKLHTIPFEEGKTVDLDTTQGKFTIPLVRYKNNSFGII